MSVDDLVAGLERAARSPEVGLRFVGRHEEAEWFSWAELRKRAREVAGGLAAIGISPGDRVGLIHPTSVELIVAFFGVLVAGGVPVPLYPPLRLGRLREYHRRTATMLRSVDAALVLGDARIGRMLGETLERARPRRGWRTLGALPEGEPSSHAADANELALIQFSSGTTSDPKPVALSHGAIWRHAGMLNAHWPDTPEVRHSGVCWLPLYHDMGLIGCLCAALERPGTLTLLPPEEFLARPALWLRTISRYGATLSPAPDFAYALATERIRDQELEGVDLSCWRVALDGAESIAPQTLERFAERFARWGFRRQALTPVYGLAEAALAVTFSPPGRGPAVRTFDRNALGAGRARPSADGVDLVSLGRPLPGVRLEVRGEDGAPVPDGQVGRLWVRSPTLMEGYFGRPRLTAETVRDGWLDTGDLGFLRHGELYLVGRAKEVIIVRGQNVAPQELERAAGSVGGVRTGCTAAVGEPRESEAGERVVLLAERRRGRGEARDGDLERAVAEAVLSATGVALDEVVVLSPGTLPRTSSGKIRRQEALRRYRSNSLTPPASTSWWALGRVLFASWRARRRAGRRPEPEEA